MELETITSPNFSIILPGPCQCHCDFCFWERSNLELNPRQYADRLEEVLNGLPEQFWQCSITGGEPLLSPVLFTVLKMVRARFDKVVFTTNGGIPVGKNYENKLTLMKAIPALAECVDHVNISRHDRDDNTNSAIFGTEMMRSGYLGRCVIMLNQYGIQVCNNCVLPKNRGFHTNGHIKWARETGFSSVCFRKPHEENCDLSPTPQEQEYRNWKVVNHSECPVCRSDTQIIEGMPVIWTASIPEPQDVMGDTIYEAVFHPDGELTADWSKNIELDVTSMELEV
jgi:MoaA/NifB/PqqE/SkfB family radical SAM enzyme